MITMEEIFVGLLMISFITFLSLQFYAMLTPRNPKALLPIVMALMSGIGGFTAIYMLVPALWALILACASGVYDNGGFIFILGIFLIDVVFLINTLYAWKQNKPIDITL